MQSCSFVESLSRLSLDTTFAKTLKSILPLIVSQTAARLIYDARIGTVYAASHHWLMTRGHNYFVVYLSTCLQLTEFTAAQFLPGVESHFLSLGYLRPGFLGCLKVCCHLMNRKLYSRRHCDAFSAARCYTDLYSIGKQAKSSRSLCNAYALNIYQHYNYYAQFLGSP